jgi:hypothetical protein
MQRFYRMVLARAQANNPDAADGRKLYATFKAICRRWSGTLGVKGNQVAERGDK